MATERTAKQPAISKIRSAVGVAPGKPSKLQDRDPHGKFIFPSKDAAEASLNLDSREIDRLQDRLFAERRRSLLVVLQGIDTAGKDGTAKSVFQFTSPLGVLVRAFGRPTEEELAHDFLWRVHKVTPRRGEIVVFNRSHYEDVLIGRVRQLAHPDEIDRRYDHINAFEQRLVETGTSILKCMLHISYEEQGERLRDRLENPDKRWKFNPSDLEDRKMWEAYSEAYEIMLDRCSTPHAPWHVIPSDSRTRRDAIVARLVHGALLDIAPIYPDPGYRPEHFEID
ncbi:polyphosphate kinase 2 family protein [bacterium]|nr:polyphosphate kinase 2 family protein [bacterium]